MSSAQGVRPGSVRLHRKERREQILSAAARAFARAGFAATGLDDVAAEAGVSRVIVYRHFESKADLYRAVLERVLSRLTLAGDRFTPATIDTLLGAAAEDPDGFRLLFQHAAREPEFKVEIGRFQARSVEIAHRELASAVPDPAWARWAARLSPTVAIEAVIAWLDAGQPDRDQAAARILEVLAAIPAAASRAR